MCCGLSDGNAAVGGWVVQAGRTALYMATQRGQTSIVEMLVDKFHANVSSRSNDGSTLMHVAAMCGNADTAMAMLRKGVPINMPNKVRAAQCLHQSSTNLVVVADRTLLNNVLEIHSVRMLGFRSERNLR